MGSCLPASRIEDLGLGKALLTRYSWWKLKPNPELIQPHWTEQDYWQPFAASIPGEAVIAYAPNGTKAMQFQGLEPGAYHGYFYNPSEGNEVEFGQVSIDSSGGWRPLNFRFFATG